MDDEYIHRDDECGVERDWHDSHREIRERNVGGGWRQPGKQRQRQQLLGVVA
jgi:hypothetical protein